MIKNIILGYSNSRGAQVAFSQAVDIARPTKARLHVTIIEPLAAAEGQVTLKPDILADATAAALPDMMTPLHEPAPDAAPTAELESVAETCRREEVFCTFNHHYGDPGMRLTQLGRLANLLVVARRDEPRAAQAQPAGRTARHLAAHATTPTLFTDREYLPPKSATLFYEPRQAGGRSLAVAGEIASLLNMALNVVCLPYGEVDASAAEEEARFALRAYHVDGEFLKASSSVAEALQNAALSWNDPFVILPAPPRKLLFNSHQAVALALGLPNTNLLLVP